MHAILFDIDGTLINSRGAGRAALAAAFASAFAREDPVEIEMSGRTDRSIARDWFRAHRLEDSDENWRKLSAAYLEHLPRTLVERQGHVLPGIPELLKLLGERENLLLGLLTGNTPEGARLKLAHFGIWEHFPFGAYGDVHLQRNAVAVDAVAHLRRHGEISPEDIVVIGDTPQDVRCARHIGAQAVAVLTGWHTRGELESAAPDVLLEDLTDAAALLRRLGA